MDRGMTTKGLARRDSKKLDGSSSPYTVRSPVQSPRVAAAGSRPDSKTDRPFCDDPLALGGRSLLGRFDAAELRADSDPV
jgi:hypothetical protein